MSSPTSIQLQVLLLIWSTTILSASPGLAFAAFVPMEQQHLAGFQAHQLLGRQDYCVNPCGQYHGQLCCDTDEVCYTDASGNAQCSQTSAPSAASSTSATGVAGGITPSTASASYTVITVTSPQDGLTTASAVASSTSLPTATSTQSPSDGVGANRDSSRLSPGAKVGIAIGVVAAVVGIIFGIVLCTRRSRSKSSSYAGPPTRARRRPDRTGIILTSYS